MCVCDIPISQVSSWVQQQTHGEDLDACLSREDGQEDEVGSGQDVGPLSLIECWPAAPPAEDCQGWAAGPLLLLHAGPGCVSDLEKGDFACLIMHNEQWHA